MTVYLAAYGTLMTSEVNALPQRSRSCLVSLGQCLIPGTMFRIWDGEANTRIDYPGLVPSRDGGVHGELFRIGTTEVDAAGLLADMDIYENCRPDDRAASSYVRSVVDVISADGKQIHNA